MVALLASVADFGDRHGTVEVDDHTAVESLLEDASALILDEAEGSSKAWVSDPDNNDPPHVVKQVCVAVAYRAWSNPDALSQMSMQQVTFTYTRNDVAEAVFLTKGEARKVRKSASTSGFQATTLVSPWSS